jgi:nucleotide-binding universal stress UspA family protein
MFPPTVILHPTDFSKSAVGAFRFALDLARRHDAALHLMHVIPSLGDDPIRGAFEVGIDEEEFYQTLETQAEGRLEQFAGEADTAGVECVYGLRRHPHPGDAILNYLDDHPVDLVAMGTHGRRAVSRMVLGSVAESVLRHASCSVLTVRADGEAEPSAVERILTPVDLSAYSAPLLRSARDVAASFAASIDVLHVIEPLPLPVPLIGGFTLNDLLMEPGERVREAVDALVERAGGAPEEMRIHVKEGHAASMILGVADDEDVDLICIASHGITGLSRVVLGSVTARVVRRAPCPVLTLRVDPEEDEEDQGEAVSGKEAPGRE